MSDRIEDELRIARGKLEYHERSVSHTFSNSRGNVSTETMKWMIEEGRKLTEAVKKLESKLGQSK